MSQTTRASRLKHILNAETELPVELQGLVVGLPPRDF